jgi:hypothetical protein
MPKAILYSYYKNKNIYGYTQNFVQNWIKYVTDKENNCQIEKWNKIKIAANGKI